jgi:hypothetical protein
VTRICIFAKSELEASRFAQTQNWGKECWFYPHSITDLRFKKNFHVLVVGITELDGAPANFEVAYNLALERGKIGRF